jgi:uncharacterized repeat protein (TIGR01451 family)
MKQEIRRVGLSFRGWILVAGLGLMVPAVALVGGSKGLAKTGPAPGLAPAVDQQSSASQIDASPLMKRIQSIAQAPRLRIIKERLAQLAPALTPLATVTIAQDASPISGSAVVQGQVIAYTIQSTNGSSSDTTTGAGGFVRIVDTAPSGTLFTNATIEQQPQFGSAWSCAILFGGTSIECHAGDGTGAGVDTFTTQEFVKIRAEVTVQASTVNGTILTNTATYEFDNNGGGVDGTATSNSVFHVVNPTADLGITKVTSNPTPTAGGAAFSYTVTVTNNGPNAARDVIVTDPLPAGIIFQNVVVVMNPASPAMNCSGPPVGTNGTIICNSANFLNGQTAVITIVAQVVPNVASGVRNNTATVTSGTPEPVPNAFPNTANVQQNIVVDAPLSIIAAGPANVCPGDTYTYHVTVLNGGSSTAINATISDPLPANTTFLSAAGTRAFTNSCSHNGGTPGTVTCAAVDIPTGLSTLDITVRLSPTAQSGALSDTAIITTAGTGTIAVGTSTTNATVGQCGVDLGITKVTSNSTPTAGGAAFSYTLTVTNNGPSAAKDLVVTDPLPPGIIFQNVSFVLNPTGAVLSCTGPPNATNGTVICNSSNFPAGQIATITINAQVVANVASGVRTNTATVSSGTPEASPNVLPNTASVQQNIVVDAPLSITKAGPAVACPGDQFTYHITVVNGGSSTALNAAISDALPPNTTFQSMSGTGGLEAACSFSGGVPGTVTCPAANIPSGQSTLDITVKLAAGAPNGNLANTATITSAGTGTIAVGNSTSTATIGCSTTLSINNTSVTEGTGGTTPATFTVSMPSSTQTVTVDYVTSDITASAPSDYTSQAGTLTFAPGVTTRSIIVPVIGDGTPEPTETFQVTLFNPTNATIGTALGTGTINDDDATGVFQFSAATANVNENAVPGSINLTINRTGDTSGVSSVGFETSDITAAQKNDYIFNSGTVQFAPGDVSKTINVLIVNDALVEAPETFRVTLQNPSGNFVVGTIGQSVVTITSDDAAPGPNPIDTAGFFVRQQYLDFLGREPDPAGLTFWTNNITSCGADPACTAAKRTDTSAAFFLSTEFQETSGNVIRTQRVAFSRLSADAASRVPYLQFMRDTRQVGQGVIIGQAGADALLEQNKQAYALAIVNSPAFIARFPVSPAAVYVDSLTVSAAVVLTVAERNAAISAFGLGGTAGRVAALRSIADSASVRAAEFSSSFVLAEYYGYLRRNPTDAPDFNDAGYQFWLTKLNTFGGDFRQADMVKSFTLSTEYRQRFGTP